MTRACIPSRKEHPVPQAAVQPAQLAAELHHERSELRLRARLGELDHEPRPRSEHLWDCPPSHPGCSIPLVEQGCARRTGEALPEEIAERASVTNPIYGSGNVVKGRSAELQLPRHRDVIHSRKILREAPDLVEETPCDPDACTGGRQDAEVIDKRILRVAREVCLGRSHPIWIQRLVVEGGDDEVVLVECCRHGAEVARRNLVVRVDEDELPARSLAHAHIRRPSGAGPLGRIDDADVEASPELVGKLPRLVARAVVDGDHLPGTGELLLCERLELVADMRGRVAEGDDDADLDRRARVSRRRRTHWLSTVSAAGSKLRVNGPYPTWHAEYLRGGGHTVVVTA